MESIKVKVTRGNEYKAFHNSQMSFYVAWNELIDNSIDNGATKVEFTQETKSITIHDNGSGIMFDADAVDKVLGFYQSRNGNDPKKIGQYGIGLKEASMKLGKGILIMSKHEGSKAMQINVPWQKGVDYVNAVSLDEEIKKGCSIQIFQDDTDAFIQPPTKTSFMYYSRLIKTGKLSIIDINGNLYEPEIDPLFDGKPEIIKGIEIDSGKFDIKIGILKKEMKKQSGIYVYSVENQRYYHYRQQVINDVKITDGLYVEIGLYNVKDDWTADKNKEGILDVASIMDYLEGHILSKWRSKLYNDKRDDTIDLLEERLNEKYGFKYGKAKRPNRTGEKKKAEPKGTPRKVKIATIVDTNVDGDVMERNYGIKIKGIKITYSSFDPASKYLTISKENKKLTVRLNQANPFMSELIEKTTALKSLVLEHLISIAIRSNKIDLSEIPFYQGNYTDIIMNQDG